MIPIHIITGFLGSGKTTFLKKLLESDNGDETLVIVNELGEVGIDDALIDPINENTFLLSNGCVCCTILTSIKETLLAVITKRQSGEIPYFRRIIIETTGLANPASLLSTISQDIHLKGLFSIHGITTLVDLENAKLQSKTSPEWAAQVVAANQIILTKRDRISEEIYNEAIKQVRRINPDADLSDNRDSVTIDTLFSIEFVKKDNQTLLFFNSIDERKHQEIETFVINISSSINWISFGIWMNLLLKKYGENILRVKGILKIEDEIEPLLIQGVQHCIYPPEHLSDWPWEDHSSKIVFITRGLNREMIRKSFDIFMKIT